MFEYIELIKNQDGSTFDLEDEYGEIQEHPAAVILYVLLQVQLSIALFLPTQIRPLCNMLKNISACIVIIVI